MPHVSLARVAALLTAVWLPLAATPVASAATWSHVDGRRDVASAQYSIPLDGFIVRAAPKVRHADVQRLKVEHAADVVRLRMSLRDLTRPPGTYRQVRARILTPDASFTVDTRRQPGGGEPQLLDGDGQVVGCDDVRWSVQRAIGSVELSVPTGCLGSPATVRVGVLYLYTRGTVAYVDDPLTGRLKQMREGRLTPAVAVG